MSASLQYITREASTPTSDRSASIEGARWPHFPVGDDHRVGSTRTAPHAGSESGIWVGLGGIYVSWHNSVLNERTSEDTSQWLPATTTQHAPTPAIAQLPLEDQGISPDEPVRSATPPIGGR